MKCIHCQSANTKKYGKMKTKRGVTTRYKCNDCSKTYTKRTGTLNYRKRKQNLRESITQMYCERMSLRGIARTLNVDIKTVMRYFMENAQVSKENNVKRLNTKDLVTSYVQFDQLETYEHTKRKPIGIQISIRHKTGEIISAKAGYTNVRALSTASVYTQAWNEKVKRNSNQTERMLKETKKALNTKGSLISCDADKKPLRIVKDMYTEPFITIQPSSNKNKKIDRVFRRIRQDVSRLGRKTLSTTKKIENLQKHLDLYIDYNNVKRVA